VQWRSRPLQSSLGPVLLGVRLLYHDKIVVCLVGLLLLGRWLLAVFDILGIIGRRVGQLREHLAGFGGRLERIRTRVFGVSGREESADGMMSNDYNSSMANSRYVLIIGVFVLLEKVTEDDAIQLLCLLPLQELAHRLQRHQARLAAGIAVHAGAQRREGDAFTAVVDGQLQACVVAASQELRCRTTFLPVDGPDGVYDLLTRELVRARDLRAACFAAVERLAFLEEVGTGGAVDCAIDAAPAEQGVVGCIDDGVDGESGYVFPDDADFGIQHARGRVLGRCIAGGLDCLAAVQLRKRRHVVEGDRHGAGWGRLAREWPCQVVCACHESCCAQAEHGRVTEARERGEAPRWRGGAWT
jgi:hypothetical protein